MKEILFILFVIVAIASLFEAVLFGIAYFNADKVECNLLWCTFTESRGTETISQDCYQNGILVNCSTMPVRWIE